MIAKFRMTKVVSLLLGAILTVAISSLSFAEIFLSPDIPITIGSDAFEERDVMYFKDSSFLPYISGSTLGILKGVNIDAFGFSEGKIIFSVDIPTTLDGVTYTERDLILYDGTNFSKLLDGSAIPDGARIDAATVLSDGSIVFSLDVPVTLGGLSFKANDLIRYNGSFTLYFSGSGHNIPESANIDGVWVSPDGDILFSLDIPCNLNGLEVKDKDIVKWSNGSFSLYFDGLSEGIPLGADLDALSSIELCEGDFNGDGDVDGSDLATFVDAYANEELLADLNGDEEVNVEDLAVFAADFGRTNCPLAGNSP